MRAMGAVILAFAVLASGCIRQATSEPDPPLPRMTSPTPVASPAVQAPSPRDVDLPLNNTSRPGPAPAAFWPVEGSFVTYTAGSEWVLPDGARRSWTNASWRYGDGEWMLSCSGAQEIGSSRAGEPTRSPIRASGAGNLTPPHVLPMPDPGSGSAASVLVWTVHDCRSMPTAVREGDNVSLEMPSASGNATYAARSGSLSGSEVWWDERTGLVLAWRVDDRDLAWAGRLVATDAPLARG